MSKIEPTIDKYGTLVRASFFADYLELVALRSRKAKIANLRDFIADTYPRVKRILNTGVSSTDVADWEPTDLADETWTCILEREEVLGSKYPFQADNGVLRRNTKGETAAYPYVSLLAITLSHAFGLMPHNKVETLLEDVVAKSMRNCGLSIGAVGPLSRANGYDFSKTMKALGGQLNLTVNPNATIRRHNANDEDVDLVAHLDWGTPRSGKWLFIGQVTCGVSDNWRNKASEPNAADWREFFSETVAPVPFLAVPHHADDSALRYVSSTQVHVLDRSRIVVNLDTTSLEEREVIDVVLSASYQSFKV